MRRRESGFTLLELLTVMAIIAILALLVLQGSRGLMERADFARCMTNLRSLYVAAASYVQEQEHWPQIDPRLATGGSTQYAEEWYQALKKYGISRRVWVCPTIQRQLNEPDLDKPATRRVDYVATPFDAKPYTPYLWSRQPWFIEKSSSHSGGNLIIFGDAQAMPLKEALRRTGSGP